MVNWNHAESTANIWRQYRVVVVKDYTLRLTVRHTKFLHISLACTLVRLVIQHNYAVVDRNSVCLQNIVKWQKIHTHKDWTRLDPRKSRNFWTRPDPTRGSTRPTDNSAYIIYTYIHIFYIFTYFIYILYYILYFILYFILFYTICILYFTNFVCVTLLYVFTVQLYI